MTTSQTHFRSISLPSRIHPTNSETELETLKSLQINSEAIQSGLVKLAELYNSVHHTKSMEDQSLSGSVELLDCCSSIREMVQMMKDNVQALQSALRRKGFDSSIRNDVSSYFSFRKKMNKCISKTLKIVKNLDKYNNGSSVSVLSQVSGITIAIFRCILVFLSASPAVKSGGWNLVSRLMVNKSVASGKDHSVVSEVGSVDLALNYLQMSVRSSDLKVVDRKIVQKSLQNLESCVDGIEGGLETLFRKLLQSRVALLNILTDN